MRENCRKILLVFASVCFVLSATNIILVLHLAEHHKDENHDPEHCPICQQAVVNAVKAVLPDPPAVKEPLLITIADFCVIRHYIKDFKFLTPHTRAPPMAL
jgi:hypothetical protein